MRKVETDRKTETLSNVQCSFVQETNVFLPGLGVQINPSLFIKTHNSMFYDMHNLNCIFEQRDKENERIQW